MGRELKVNKAKPREEGGDRGGWQSRQWQTAAVTAANLLEQGGGRY